MVKCRIINMKKLLLISSLLLCSNGWAYNEAEVAKLKTLNACEGCDLSGANLRGADLSEANLSKANLRGANLSGADLSQVDLKNTDLRTTNLKKAILDGAKYCKTQMPWGEVNGDCDNLELGGTGFRRVL